MQQPSPGAITAGDVAPQLSLADAAGTEIDLYDDAFAGRPQAWLLHGPQHAAQAAACAERLHA